MDVMLRVPLMQELFALPVVHIVLISVPTFLKSAVHIFLKKKKKQTKTNPQGSSPWIRNILKINSFLEIGRAHV